jgi:hypothetical protein
MLPSKLRWVIQAQQASGRATVSGRGSRHARLEQYEHAWKRALEHSTSDREIAGDTETHACSATNCIAKAAGAWSKCTQSCGNACPHVVAAWSTCSKSHCDGKQSRGEAAAKVETEVKCPVADAAEDEEAGDVTGDESKQQNSCFCCMCKRECAEADFSPTQWRKPSDHRKCRHCLSKQAQANGLPADDLGRGARLAEAAAGRARDGLVPARRKQKADI